jgi:hypothetical protein
LVGDEHGTKLFGSVAYTIGTDVEEGQTLKHGGSVGKRILGGTEQGEEFVETGAATSSTQVEVGVEGMLTMAAGRTKVVGAGNGDGTEDSGHRSRAEALESSGATAGTGDGSRRLSRGEQGTEASNQGGTQFFDDAQDVLLDLLEVTRSFLDPRAKGAGEGRHASADGGNNFFQTGGICARMHIHLLWETTNRVGQP